MNFGILLPEIIVVGTALLILLVDAFQEERKSSEVLFGISIAGLLVALWSLTANPWLNSLPKESAYELSGMVAVDGLSGFFRAVLLLGALLVAFVSYDYNRKNGIEIGSFFSLLLFATAGGMFLAVAGDMVTFYVGLELLSITSYILVGTLRKDPRSNEAALKYFLNGAVASSVLLFGFSLLYGLTGQTGIGAVATELSTVGMNPLTATAVFLVLAGLAFKVAAVPFHLWAPDTYEGAATPITAFLSVVSKGATFAAILRVFYITLVEARVEWSLAFAVLAVLSMTIGNISALRQKNIKRMLAYSSIAHAGYILAGLAVATATGFSSVMFYVLAYTFMNMAAFAVVIAVSIQRDSEDVAAFTGLVRSAPWLAVIFLLALVSLIGMPPFAGFWAKLYIFRATIQGGLTWLAIAIALNSAISIGYYYNVVRVMFVREEKEPTKLQVGSALQIGLALAAIGFLALGLAPDTFLRWVSLAALVQ